MDEMEQLDGIKIGGRNINNIRYADDTVLLADTEERLQELIDRLDEEGRAIGLKINIGKIGSDGGDKKDGAAEGGSPCQWRSSKAG